MLFEVLAFLLWSICLIVYIVMGWRRLLKARLSEAVQPTSFVQRQPSFELRRIESVDGDDTATYLCRLGYEVGSKLGKGAYAVVMEAYSNRHGRNVAVKIIDKKQLSSKSFRKFMSREVEALRQVDHKNVVSLIEVIESGKKFYIIMELAQNGDLLQLLQKRGHLHENEARQLFRKILKGVLHCHRKGIAHRDLKLENILLSRKNEPIISDFGFARYVGGNTETCQNRARSCTFCGSYAYAAPEILQGIPYDATFSDVWSLGVVLFTMVTGQFPFDDRDKKQLLRQTLAGKLVYPASCRHLSDQIKDLIKKMLVAKMEDRLTLEETFEHPWIKIGKGVASTDKNHSFNIHS